MGDIMQIELGGRVILRNHNIMLDLFHLEVAQVSNVTSTFDGSLYIQFALADGAQELMNYLRNATGTILIWFDH